MNGIADGRLLEQFDGDQHGVYSSADLRTALAEPHAAAFARRLQRLGDQGELRRFCRGFYVRTAFDLATLSQRLAPESYVSFGTVLARELVVGTDPARHVVAVKLGRTRRYEALGFVIEHVGTTADLLFGFSVRDGVRYADAEKAVIDTLYYHLRGRRYGFDLHSDINLRRLDRKKLRDYLRRYQNPKFVTFAKRLLELP